jgi:hypothetical protein
VGSRRSGSGFCMCCVDLRQKGVTNQGMFGSVELGDITQPRDLGLEIQFCRKNFFFNHTLAFFGPTK